MNWVAVALGVLLIVAPFLSGYSGQPGLLWFSVIFGVAIAVLGYFRAYIWAAAVGLIVFVWPWIFGFAGTPAAIWAWIIGAAVALLGGYVALFANRGERAAGSA